MNKTETKNVAATRQKRENYRTHLSAQQWDVEGIFIGSERVGSEVNQAGPVVRNEAIDKSRLGPAKRLNETVLSKVDYDVMSKIINKS